MKKLILFSALFLILTAGVFAQKAQQKRYALVIGNQDYQESALSNPRADADLMDRSLKDCGFTVTTKYDLTYTEMAVAFADFASKVNENGGKDTITFIYYSGHGVQIDGKNYMVPTDNKGITDEIKAKSRCKAIDDLIELVPSQTQIVVLDACRNNPFRETKVKFTKGLTRIAAPKSVPNFLTLFSTGDGQTAEDGTGKNSLFTEVLARKIKTEMNTQVLVVFNDVADDIKTRTSGKQIPLIAGTSVNIELMNAEIAAAKQAEIQAQLKQMKKEAEVSKSATYESDKKLLEAELQIMKQREYDAKLDKKEKDEKQRKENEIKAQNQKEMERIQKEVEKQRKALQKQKADQKSSQKYVAEIEENKQSIQTLRTNIAGKIYDLYKEIQSEADAKLQEVDNRPLGLTESDSNGNITKSAKTKRDEEKKTIKEKAQADKLKNKEILYETIVEEETQRVNQLNSDLKTIKTATYTASSINNEVLFDISNYDGASFKWNVHFRSNIFDDNYLFNSSIDFTYEQLCKSVLNQKYIVPTKMNDAQNDSYYETIVQYDELIRGDDSILYVEVDYKIEPVVSASQYKITTSKVSLYCFNKDNEPVLVNSKKYEYESTVKWPVETVLRTVDELIDSYELRDKNAAKAKKQAEERAEKNKKVEEQKKEREERKDKVYNLVTSSEKKSKSKEISEEQETLSGINADILFANGVSGQIGYYFPILDYMFVNPYIGVHSQDITVKSVKYDYEGNPYTVTKSYIVPFFAIGCEAGGSYCFKFDTGVLDPYLTFDICYEQSLDKAITNEGLFNLGGHIGAAYIYYNSIGFNGDIGLYLGTTTHFVARIGVFLTQDYIKGLF